MKFQLPPPAVIKLPGGKTLEYSLCDMVRYIARNSRKMGAAPDIEGVRLGQRLDEAFAAPKNGVVEITDADGIALKEEIKRPSCGWANLTGTELVRTGKIDDDGKPTMVARQTRVPVSGLDVLSLIESALSA